MCSNGQYAAFSVKKVHISKNYILFPIKTHPNNTEFKQDHQPDKNITRKLLFRVNTSLFWSTKWKVTLVCGHTVLRTNIVTTTVIEKQKCTLTQVL